MRYALNVATNARARATILAVMLLGACPAAALAQTDSKILPATVCQVAVPLEDLSPAVVADLRNSLRYSANGRIENWHPTLPITVVCPLVRDNVGDRLDWLRVTFFDGYPGPGPNGKGLFACRLRANNRKGTGHVASDYRDSEGVDGMNMEADGAFDFEDMTLAGESEDGSYTLTCTIPPVWGNGTKSYLGTIRYQEP